MPTPLTEGHGRSTGLVDVLDRVLDKGLVVAGDIKVSLAEVELLTIRIRLLICSIDKAEQIGLDWWKFDHHLSPGKQALSAENEELRKEIRAARTQAGVADAAAVDRRSAEVSRRRQEERPMPVERAAGGTSLIDVLDRVLDKGIVIDAWVRVSLVGIDLITVEARVVVASIDTYLKYSEAVGAATTASRPAMETKPYEEVIAENAALRAQLQSGAAAGRAAGGRRRAPRARRAAKANGSGEGAPAATATTSAGRDQLAAGCGCSKAFSAAPRSPTARSTRCSGSARCSACRQSICLRQAGRRAATLFTVAALRPAAATAASFSVSLDDWSNPLVHALDYTVGTRTTGAVHSAVGAPPAAVHAVRGLRRSTSSRSARRAFATSRSACCCSPAPAQLTAGASTGSPACSARSSIRFFG